jgi:hypothetical protein
MNEEFRAGHRRLSIWSVCGHDGLYMNGATMLSSEGIGLSSAVPVNSP